MQKIISTWQKLNNFRGVTPEQFFKEAYEFELDLSSGTHTQHLNVIKEFLSDRVGKDAYIDPAVFPPNITYVKKDISKMSNFDKICHVWNTNLNAQVTVTQMQELILAIFDSVIHRTMISEMMRLVCEKSAVGSRTIERLSSRGSGSYVYSIKDKISVDLLRLISEIYYNQRASYKKNSDQKISTKKNVVEKSDDDFVVFKPHHFTRINDEVFVKVTYEDAQELNRLYCSILQQIDSTKNELTKTKSKLAEILDENQGLNTELKMVKEGKVSSMQDSIKCLKDHLND